MDVYTSVVVVLIVGWLGALTSQLFRMPRIVCMILFGIALYPALHPALMNTETTVSTSSGPLKIPDGANPSSSIRTMALLIALARGGLSVKLSFFKVLGPAMIIFAVIPYGLELMVEGLVAPHILPDSVGFGPSASQLVVFAGASVFAPLSPSIVIPNMLAFVEQGLTAAGRLVLMGAPLEVSTALLTEGILQNYIHAQNLGTDPSVVLYFIPVYILGSAAYGFAWSGIFYAYTHVRKNARVTNFVGKMDPIEPLLVFLIMFILCYTTSNDDVNIPRLIGFFAAVAFGVGVQYWVPEIADALCLQLKPVWVFAECFLFVLTGCVIRPALDGGQAKLLFGNMFAVLLCGQVGRMVGDFLAAIVWQVSILKSAPWVWNKLEWRDLVARVAFCWCATVPKATLQGSLPSKLAAVFKAGNNPAAAAFVGPAAAIAILYMATIGSLLTFSVGTALATYFQNKEPATKPEEEVALEALTSVDEEKPLYRATPRKTNLLTGIPVAEDILVAPAEVVVDPEHRSPSTWATGASYMDSRPEPIAKGPISGTERVGPVLNLLTGLEAEDDAFVAPREVTLNLAPHSSPSQYMTGTAYDATPPRPPPLSSYVAPPLQQRPHSSSAS